jgi:polysaccharide biosynthesis/export protein
VKLTSHLTLLGLVAWSIAGGSAVQAAPAGAGSPARSASAATFVPAAPQPAGQPSAAAQKPAPDQKPATEQKPAVETPAPGQKPTPGQKPAQGQPAPNQKPMPGQKPGAPPMELPAGITPPADYVIGPEDVLTVFFWREKDLSGDVQVRPDGRISLPLLNDIDAAGLTPDELRSALTEAARKYYDEPTVTVVVKQINSRKVFITGNVGNPAPYPMLAPMSVMQLITMAGGLTEYANRQNITILRTEGGKPVSLRFNYKDVERGRNLQQNIMLKPGDQVIVP